MEPTSRLLEKAQHALKEKNLSKAEALVTEALGYEPSNAAAYNLLGLISSAHHNNADALKHLEMAASLCSTDPKIFHNYGTLLQRTAQYAKAAEQYEKAIALQPDYLPALHNYSAVLFIMGHTTAAEQTARKIIALNPTLTDPYVNLGNSIKDQGRIDEAIETYRKGLLLKPDHAIAGSNMLLCLNYSTRYDDETVCNEHKQWEQRIKKLALNIQHKHTDFSAHKSPLRIGYISGDFKTHSIAYFIEPILRHHDRSNFDIYCYSDVANPDPVTLRLEKLPLHWRPIHDKDNDVVAAMIVEDELDIMVDLAGHAGNRRITLFLDKLAPVQITYIGYPNTTGLSTMDYRLTDEWADPPGRERYYTEKLYRLPGGFLCYRPPSTAPAIQETPALANGYITFGSFNNLPKINERTASLWSKILTTVPSSKLLLKTKPLNDASIRKSCRDLFRRYGIEAERLVLKSHSPSLETHLSCYNEVDIALDTFPYNGTTTTCEALWMGVPVITLAGQNHAGRVGVSLLSRIGLSGMIAETEDRYVACASFLAGDIPRLTRFRKGLRGAVAQSSLCDGKTFTEKLEHAYREMWKNVAEAIKQ